MGTSDVFRAIVSPMEKLIDAVSGAIGKAYEPRHIRKLAEAKAHEISMIAEAVRNNSDVPIVYNSKGVSIDTSNFEEIAKRASRRLAYQEIAKQQNIEAVVDIAYKELESTETVSNEPVNRDWMLRFFNSVEDISNEDMQRIWGRILAGEIKEPNTFSYRTLEKLKNMTQQEAKCFQLVSSLALYGGGKCFILYDDEIMNRHNVHFVNILELEECGLMSAQTLSFTLNSSVNEASGIHNPQIIGIIRGKEDKMKELEIPCYVFTESGSQLMKAISPQVNQQYILDCLEAIRKKHKDFTVTAHNIKSISGNGIEYDDTNILSPENT